MKDTAAPLDGHVALITGASSGLGRATASALAVEGAAVALLARSATDLAGVADSLTAQGHTALAVPSNLADEASLDHAVGLARQTLGPIRILVNAAATDIPGPVADLSVESWDRVLSVNLRAVFLLCRLVLPDMVDLGQGTIVNVSSVAGRRGWANASAYCASKFALTGFTQALAAEVTSHGIRACVVYPGAMATHWGTWSADERRSDSPTPDPRAALPPDAVADFIAWIVTAPPELVLNEATVTPLDETGWP
jgi:NADP-dependent 3-hydroxy acid dehydrogenase YdfG